MSQGRMRKRFLDCKNMTLAEAESYARGLCEQQRDVMFHIGDLFRYCKARWPDTHEQVWPETVSPGMLARAGGVCAAYPDEADRQVGCTYTQFMQNSGKPNRKELLEDIVTKGLTSDESRKAKATDDAGHARPSAARWLLAVDVNYHLHRHWFSGAGVEAAKRVTLWIERTVERLKEKGLTDVVCCFDSKRNFRKELTAEWEDKYKDRPPKDPELGQQLSLVKDLLSAANFLCVAEDGMEADDLLASYAVQFDGRVTILAQDKDLKQCLSDKCNMLLDVDWEEDPTSGDMLPTYKWLSAKQHTEATGLRPDQWAEFQTIMGDNTDGVKGAPGIGEKGAGDLIKEFGTLDAVLEAARKEDERIKPKKRESLLQLAECVDVMCQLVTLRTDIQVPEGTRV